MTGRQAGAQVGENKQHQTVWLAGALAISGIALSLIALMGGAAIHIGLAMGTLAVGLIGAFVLKETSPHIPLAIALGLILGVWELQTGSFALTLAPLMLAAVLTHRGGDAAITFALSATVALPAAIYLFDSVAQSAGSNGFMLAATITGLWAVAIWKSSQQTRVEQALQNALQEERNSNEQQRAQEHQQYAEQWQSEMVALKQNLQNLGEENKRLEAELASSQRATTPGAQSASTRHISQMIERTQRINDLVQKSSEQAEQANEAVHVIASSNREVVDVVGSVDEIAFQTNLLALNASVEAARSGDHGKGFAVVATEVRNLALRSAESARQIRKMMEASTDKINEGLNRVRSSRQTASSITTEVQGLNEILEELKAESSPNHS